MQKEKIKNDFYPLVGVDVPLVSLSMVSITANSRTERVFEQCYEKGEELVLVCHDDQDLLSCSIDDLRQSYAYVGTISHKEMFNDNSYTYFINVKNRVRVSNITRTKDFVNENIFAVFASVEFVELVPFVEKDCDVKSIRTLLLSLLKKYSKGRAIKLNEDMMSVIESAPTLTLFCDSIASQVLTEPDQKREYNAIKNENELADYLVQIMDLDSVLQDLMNKIRERAKNSIEVNQKIYFLSEHLKSAQQEMRSLKHTRDTLGIKDNSGADEDMPDELDDISILKAKIKDANMPAEVTEKCNAELKKLAMQPGFSQDAAISRNYIETLLSLPWNKRSEIKKDLQVAEQVLDHDHYGLEKVKERILEYLAVQNRADRLHAPIICLVGPPGVGKTSLGMSIAKATGRTYVRVALGGMRDEAEIRGHRRTYVGALPGKIVQKLMKCGVKNPLFLLDEIDKISTDSYRGDPASALLEVLDPEQNKTFTDNYLEVDFDLSDVMFVATSNSLNIPPALRDRMEIINLSSYTEEEKLHIARNHLIPKQLAENHVDEKEITFTDDALLSLIRNYTSEAGVRNLEREIGRLCRKTVKEIMLSGGKVKKLKITPESLKDMLGPWVFDQTDITLDNKVGIVNGLAYTSVGGEILMIEASCIPGFGKQVFTGKLGEVMRESISAAFTVVRSFVADYGYTPQFFKQKDFHIHCPEGAIPKDGPSAGIAMCTAIISAITGTPVRGDVAMTGEITLRGEVLPIGGLKEKLIGAVRGGVKKVLIPYGNTKDLVEVPESTLKMLKVVPVKHIREVFAEALAGEIHHNGKKESKKVKAEETAVEDTVSADTSAAKKKTAAKTARKSTGTTGKKKTAEAAVATESSGTEKTDTQAADAGVKNTAKKTKTVRTKKTAADSGKTASASGTKRTRKVNTQNVDLRSSGDELIKGSDEFTDGMDSDDLEVI